MINIFKYVIWFVTLSTMICAGGFYIVSGHVIIISKLEMTWAWLNAQNPMVAGAISLWVLGTLTLITKGLPVKFWKVLVKQSTIVMTLNNVDDVYDDFLRWYFNTGHRN